VNTPIFSQTTERIWKRFGPLESLSNKLHISTEFAYPDLMENVNFDQIGQKGACHLSEEYHIFSQSTRIQMMNGKKY